MTRCEEFYEKWKRDPNWCEKSPVAVSRINRYITVTEVYPIFKNFSERSLRPLLGKNFAEHLDEAARILDRIYDKKGVVTREDLKTTLQKFPMGKTDKETLRCLACGHKISEKDVQKILKFLEPSYLRNLAAKAYGVELETTQTTFAKEK